MKATRIMIQIAFSLLFVLFFFQEIVFSGELTPGEKRRIESGAIDSFETIISHWRREKYDEIYEYGDRMSQEMMSKEKFMSEMRIKRCVLASSWETLRDIEAKMISPNRVHVKARMGFRGPRGLGETRFFTQVFEMTLDKGEWRIELRRLLHCPY
jgi:hypothetical protein